MKLFKSRGGAGVREEASLKHPLGAKRETGPSLFDVTFSRALARLEIEVHGLLASGWEESRRRLAQEMSTALRDASRSFGRDETRILLHAITSLLAMHIGEILSVHVAHREKLLELLDRLRSSAESKRA